MTDQSAQRPTADSRRARGGERDVPDIRRIPGLIVDVAIGWVLTGRFTPTPFLDVITTVDVSGLPTTADALQVMAMEMQYRGDLRGAATLHKAALRAGKCPCSKESARWHPARPVGDGGQPGLWVAARLPSRSGDLGPPTRREAVGQVRAQ